MHLLFVLGIVPSAYKGYVSLLVVTAVIVVAVVVRGDKTQIHPSELKPAVTDALNAILQPVRDHFAKGDAKKLLDTVRKYKVTR